MAQGSANLAKSQRAWQAMKDSTTNDKHQGWPTAGMHGVRVCERWFNSFDAFMEDMGPQPDSTLLGRRNRLENFGPENCKWMTDSEFSSMPRIKTLLRQRDKERATRGEFPEGKPNPLEVRFYVAGVLSSAYADSLKAAQAVWDSLEEARFHMRCDRPGGNY